MRGCLFFSIKGYFESGTTLFAVGERRVRQFKACPICLNKRIIKVRNNIGIEYNIACPYCPRQQKKGETFEDFYHYKAEAYIIGELERSMYDYGKLVRRIIKMDSVGEKYTVTNANIIEYYSSEQEAEEEADKLNSVQAELMKKFLNVDILPVFPKEDVSYR